MTTSTDELQQQVNQRLKTAYELARAATATEEGRKAIDFFYHVHLNNWPGFANDLFATHYKAREAEKHQDCIEKESVEHHHQEMMRMKANLDAIGGHFVYLDETPGGIANRYRYHKAMYEQLSKESKS